MGKVAANIAVAWPSTVVSIPSGWSRETSLDSRYIVGANTGADTDLTTDAGHASHTHTSPAHTPTQQAHSHSIVQSSDSDNSRFIVSGSTDISSRVHQHQTVLTSPTTGINQSATITVNTTNNELSFSSVIWIKSDGTPDTIPSGAIAFFASDTFPTGWSRVYGNRYLKGAVAVGDGGATGGANTHEHTSPSHTHYQDGHYHSGETGEAAGVLSCGGSGYVMAPDQHTHMVEVEEVEAENQSVTTIISSSSNEPPYTKVNAVQSSDESLPYHIICLWLGTHATIPSDWERYTALDGRWIKNCNADSEVATTGGSTQHTHAASDCEPTQDTHTHNAGTYPLEFGLNAGSGVSSRVSYAEHYHDITLSQEVAINDPTTVTINNCAVGAAYPPYRTVIFIRYTVEPGPTVTPSCYTSYDVNAFDQGSPDAKVTPEVEAAIRRGDRRFMRQEEIVI